jgi:hypothetical protein
MSYNTKCKCGSPGYQGFSSFECSNAKCELYVAPAATAPTQLPPAIVPPSTQSSVSNIINQIWGNIGMPPMPRSPAVAPPPPPPPPPPPAPIGNLHPPMAPVGSWSNQRLIGNDFMYLLWAANAISVDSAIAGGAPRDWYFHKMARDIDIFTTKFDIAAFKGKFPTLPITAVGQSKSVVANYPSTIDVWETAWNGECFQIINTHDVGIADHVDTFDFGINMIYIKLDGFEVRTPEFTQDVLASTLTCYASRMTPPTLARLPARTTKMKGKFPGWPIDIK